MGPLERVVDALSRLARRRARLIVTAYGCLVAALFILCDTLPAEHRARALVAPVGPGPTGPVERLRELALAPPSLATVASEARVSDSRSLGELLAGLPAEPGRRVLPEVVVVQGQGGLEHIVVHASGATEQQARDATDALAAQLVACDVAVGAGLAGPGAPPMREAQAGLDAFRVERGQFLRDVGLEERHRALADRITEDRVALVTLRAQLSGAAEEAERLEALARDEAARAFQNHKDEEARLAAAPPQRPQVVAPIVVPAGPPVVDRLAQLEAELQRLLATLTERHPEVRRTQRLLDAERRSQAAPTPGAGAPPARPDAPREARTAPGTEPVALPSRLLLAIHALPADPSAVPISDDEAPVPPPAAQTGVEAWLTRSPSYGLWASARARSEATRVEVDAREQTLAARLTELATLARAVDAQAQARAEEARLAAAAATETARLPAAPTQPTVRLAVIEAAQVIDSRSPWGLLLPGLALAALAALFIGLGVDASDRTPHGREDLEGLGVPVLGVLRRVTR